MYNVQQWQTEHLLMEWTTLENDMEPKSQIYIRIKLFYLFTQMRFKLKFCLQITKMFLITKLSIQKQLKTILTLADTYKIGFRSWV